MNFRVDASCEPGSSVWVKMAEITFENGRCRR